MIDSPGGYLTTVTTRLAIDQLRSARVRREQYPGEWLPEPLIRNEDDDPATRAEIADSLSMAFLVLLESLSPELLVHCGDIGSAEIVEMLRPVACASSVRVARPDSSSMTIVAATCHHIAVYFAMYNSPYV